jgi:PilZ domain
MAYSERRNLQRFSMRVPLRFRPIGLAADRTEHFTEATNISRGGFFFVTSAPLQVGMPIEATIRMPVEVTGDKPNEAHCRARVVHARADAYSDGRMGYGAEIESYIEQEKPKAARAETSRPNVAIPSSLSRNNPGGSGTPKP